MTLPKSFPQYLKSTTITSTSSPAKAEHLPPHRSYDHAIELLDEHDLPSVGPIYSTSQAESIVLKQEIDSLLSKDSSDLRKLPSVLQSSSPRKKVAHFDFVSTTDS